MSRSQSRETKPNTTTQVSLPFRCIHAENDTTVIEVPSVEVTNEEVEKFDQAMRMFPNLLQSDRERVFGKLLEMDTERLIARSIALNRRAASMVPFDKSQDQIDNSQMKFDDNGDLDRFDELYDDDDSSY